MILTRGNIMRIGEQLKTIRKSAGLTQEDVANKLCITRQALSNWEQGKTIPDLYMFARLAAVYQFSPDEFLLGESYFKEMHNMRTNFSDAQVEHLIKKSYTDFAELTPLSGGLTSQTFSFHSDKKKYVFQIGGARNEYEKQLFISKRYGNIVPVREVLSVNETDNGIAYCISRFIEGRKLFDLSDRERREISASVIETLSKMAQAQIPSDCGYGRFDSNGHAPYATWLDFISAIYNDGVCDWSTLALKGFSETVVRKAIGELQENIGYVKLEKPCLVHGDIGSYNIIALDGSIAGFIDWGMAIYGDPLFDVANLLFWDEKKTEHLTEMTVRKYYTDEKNKRKLFSYVLRIGLEEIYNTVVLNLIGYDVNWVCNRLDEVVKNGLNFATKRTELSTQIMG